MTEDWLTIPAPPADVRIPYGPHPSQFGDLRLPADAGPHPLVVALHGGFWRARYDLLHLGHLCAALTSEGFATWNLEYRRVGEAGGGWPGMLEDVTAGLAQVPVWAHRHGVDLERVITLGHSAGGHLALWLAGQSGHGVPLRGVVALAAVSDLRRAFDLNLSQGAVREFLGGDPLSVPDRYAQASPMARLPLGVRQILIHGTADESVPYELSVEYARAAAGAGDAAQLVTLPGVGHLELVDPRTAAWPVVRRAVTELL